LRFFQHPRSPRAGADTTSYGDTGLAGGIIFYDDEDDGTDDIVGARYLEAAPASTESDNIQWNGFQTDVNGDDYTGAQERHGIGDGQANTTKIVAVLGNNGGTRTASGSAMAVSTTA